MSATRLRTWGLVLLCTLAVGAVWAGPQAHLPPQLQAACERARAEAMKPDSAHKANYTPTVTSSRDLPIVPNWSYTGTQELSYSGASVGSAGDVNGDGYNDVFISAPYYSDAYSTAGAVFVFHGSATGVSASPDWSAYGTMDEAHFGWSVAAAGDVNGDGYGDLIVGAPHHGANQEGRVSVYFGSASGLSVRRTGMPRVSGSKTISAARSPLRAMSTATDMPTSSSARPTTITSSSTRDGPSRTTAAITDPTAA